MAYLDEDLIQLNEGDISTHAVKLAKSEDEVCGCNHHPELLVVISSLNPSFRPEKMSVRTKDLSCSPNAADVLS